MVAFLAKGGILVGPILLCSMVALTLFLERCIRFARSPVCSDGLVAQVADWLRQGQTARARELLQTDDTPMARVAAHGIEVGGADADMLEMVMRHAVDEEVRGLSRYLQALATIGNITPVLGLLGTVIGMIKAFMVIQEMGGKVNAAVLAGGIWEAMLTTALGLAVALPTLVGHSYLLARVARFEARLEDGAVVLMKALCKRPAAQEGEAHGVQSQA